MEFEPKTKEQLVPFDKNVAYPFEIISAEDKASKKGNDMLELKLRVWTKSGGTMTVSDWIVNMESMLPKLRSFAESIGRLDDYHAGSLPADSLAGAQGKVIMSLKDDPQYGEKWSVGKYVVDKPNAPGAKQEPEKRKAPATAKQKDALAASGSVPNGDDIPF